MELDLDYVFSKVNINYYLYVLVHVLERILYNS